MANSIDDGYAPVAFDPLAFAAKRSSEDAEFAAACEQLGNKLLAAVKEMKAGKIARITQVRPDGWDD